MIILEEQILPITKELIQAAYRHVQSQKTLYVVIDEAHLLDMGILRKLRLLFERFPKKHNLVLLGHPELMFRLSMMCNEDIKSRISYSRQVLPLHDADLADFIVAELAAAGMGANTFDEAALQVVLRAVQGNLRLCRNLYCRRYRNLPKVKWYNWVSQDAFERLEPCGSKDPCTVLRGPDAGDRVRLPD